MGLGLAYARYRGGADGDFGRISRQQQVLRAIVARASVSICFAQSTNCYRRLRIMSEPISRLRRWLASVKSIGRVAEE